VSYPLKPPFAGVPAASPLPFIDLRSLSVQPSTTLDRLEGLRK